jgi:hypothetical protein
MSTHAFQWWWACEPVYVLSNMALKFSIGIFLLRIAVSRTHKIIIWTAVAAVELYGVFYFFLFVLQCRPSAYFWTQYTGGKGSCIDPKITVDATYAYSAISCVVDWTLGIIPVFLVWNLQMNPRTKISVAMILAVGAMLVFPVALLNQSTLVHFTKFSWQCLNSNHYPHPICQRSRQSCGFSLCHHRRSACEYIPYFQILCSTIKRNAWCGAVQIGVTWLHNAYIESLLY